MSKPVARAVEREHVTAPAPATRRSAASRRRSRTPARPPSARSPRGRSGSPPAAAAPSASAACRARCRPAPGCRSARRDARAARGAATARTISTYSRVFPSGFPHSWPCQPSTTCGPDVPSPIRKRPPESRSSVTAVIAAFAGERPGSCMIAVPSFDRRRLRAEPGERRDRIDAPRLRRPGRVVAEPLRLARQLDQLQRARAGLRVPHVEAELHRVRCYGNDHDDLGPRPAERLEQVRAFMDERVLPNEQHPRPRGRRGRRARRRAAATRCATLGLWAPHVPPEAGGTGTGFLDYAYLNEQIGRTAVGPARLRLPGAGRRQRRDPPPVRHRRAEGALALPARRRRDPLVLLDDRARGAGLRSDDAAHACGARRRRLGDRRPQVVLVGRRGRGVRDRHGGHRSRTPRRTRARRRSSSRPTRRASTSSGRCR